MQGVGICCKHGNRAKPQQRSLRLFEHAGKSVFLSFLRTDMQQESQKHTNAEKESEPVGRLFKNDIFNHQNSQRGKKSYCSRKP